MALRRFPDIGAVPGSSPGLAVIPDTCFLWSDVSRTGLLTS